MWLYDNKVYDKLSTIRKVKHLSNTNIIWLRNNRYICEITKDKISPDTEIITYKEREPYNETKESSF